MKLAFLFWLLLLSFESSISQNKITFQYSKQKGKSEQKTSTRSDTAFITLEEGFKNDTVEFDINHKRFSVNTYTTLGVLGRADRIAIPKTADKETITIKINNLLFKDFILNKDYTLLYINYQPTTKKLKIEYSLSPHFYL